MKHVFALSVFLRIALISQVSSDWFSERVELSTPLNSWTRLKEGVALKEAGISPYEGGIFHESPLTLLLFQAIVPFGHMIVGLFFVIIDLLIAFCLAKATRLYHKNELQRQSTEQQHFGKGVEPLLIISNDSLPSIVAGVYLLNPYTILSCCAYSTISLNHLSIALLLWMALKGNWFLCGLGLSLAVHFSLYPIMLVLPLSLMAYKSGGVTMIIKFILYLLIWTIVIMSLSHVLTDSWDYIIAIYGVILSVPDFTPNVGLFWYFFTDMFEHFRLFFLCVLQINAFIHCIPFTIRFSNYPMFLMYTLLSIIAIFKSYPTVADIALPLALLPLWSHTFRYLRFTYILIGCVVVTTVTGPIMWYLWIHAGSANANFYFGMTLTYSVTQIFFLLDVVQAFLSHQYDLKHGLPRLDKQDKPVQLKLK